MRYYKYKHPLSTIGTIIFFAGIFTALPFLTTFFVAIICWSIGSHYEKEHKFWSQEIPEEKIYETEEPIIEQQAVITDKFQFCTECGFKYKLENSFCNACGKKSGLRLTKVIVSH